MAWRRTDGTGYRRIYATLSLSDLIHSAYHHHLSWGVNKPFSLVPLFSRFSLFSKRWLLIEYHFHIWQMLPQFSCSDIRQILKWFKEINAYFAKPIFFLIEKLPNGASEALSPGQRRPLSGGTISNIFVELLFQVIWLLYLYRIESYPVDD